MHNKSLFENLKYFNLFLKIIFIFIILFLIIEHVYIIIFKKQIKTTKKCYPKTLYFLFLKIENKKHFLIIKCVFCYKK